MITVHHLEDSRSQRILWLLEELELDYEVERYERDPKTGLAPASLTRVHPLGRSPVVTDGDVTVAESGAIIEHLVHAYDEGGRLQQDVGSNGWRQQQFWLHYAEGSLMPLLLLRLVFDQLPKKAPMILFPAAKLLSVGFNSRFIGPRLKSNLDFVESSLEGRDWLSGDRLGPADIQMSFPLEASVARAKADQGRPNLAAYVERFQSRPAYRRALERGGPYAYGPSDSRD